MSSATPDPQFRWSRVAAAAFLPTILFSIGEGAIIPVIPIVAHDLGAGLAGAGLVAAMLVIGKLLGDLPSGALVSRLGERTAMLGASAVVLVGMLLAVLAPSVWMLGAAILLVGTASSIFQLARHAFMTVFVPREFRARALSTLGGTHRLGFFIGPFVTAAVISLTGDAAAALWIHVAACLATGLVLLVFTDPAEMVAGRAPAPAAGERPSLWATLVANRRVLLALGSGSAAVAALRASRNVILPLWAVSIGVDGATAAAIIGAAGAVDFALFYLGGWIMDNHGRLWTAVPSMIGLGAGHLVLALTHDVDGAVVWFIVAAGLLAVANGIGSGILMTLGADLADPAHPAPFLGAWRFTNDTGAAAAPVLIAGITAAASLPVAAAVLGAIGLWGALNMRIFIPRYAAR